MADVPIEGGITVLDVELPVTFDTTYRNFEATYRGEKVSARDWDEFENRIKKAIQKNRATISLPFVSAEAARAGRIVSWDARQSAPIVQWNDGERETVTNSRHTPLRPDVDIAELTRLRKAALDANEALRAFIRDSMYRERMNQLSTIAREEIDRVIGTE